MNTALYVLANEYREAAEKMADLDLPVEVIRDTLEGLSGELTTKATNVAMFVRNLEASADAIKLAEDQMAARRKAIENRARNIKEYLKSCMETTGILKIDTPYFKLSVRENPPAVVVDMESAIPAGFWRQPEPPPPMLDKKAILTAIKEGKDVPGCHAERGTRVEIK